MKERKIRNKMIRFVLCGDLIYAFLIALITFVFLPDNKITFDTFSIVTITIAFIIIFVIVSIVLFAVAYIYYSDKNSNSKEIDTLSNN